MKGNALRFIVFVIIGAVLFYSIENWDELKQRKSTTYLVESYTISDVHNVKAVDTSSIVYGIVKSIMDYKITVEIVNNTRLLYSFTPYFSLIQATKTTTASSVSYKVKSVGVGWHPKHYVDEKLRYGEVCEYEIDLDDFEANVVEGQYILNANGILIYFDFDYKGFQGDGTIVETQKDTRIDNNRYDD